MASGPADGVSRYSDVASIKDFALPSTSKFQIIVILTKYMQKSENHYDRLLSKEYMLCNLPDRCILH